MEKLQKAKTTTTTS